MARRLPSSRKNLIDDFRNIAGDSSYNELVRHLSDPNLFLFNTELTESRIGDKLKVKLNKAGNYCIEDAMKIDCEGDGITLETSCDDIQAYMGSTKLINKNNKSRVSVWKGELEQLNEICIDTIVPEMKATLVSVTANKLILSVEIDDLTLVNCTIDKILYESIPRKADIKIVNSTIEGTHYLNATLEPFTGKINEEK